MPVEIPTSLHLDLAPNTGSMMESVMEGLSSIQKTLPSKYFYDALGSQLFDKICELPEYYPTRTELSILEENLPAIEARLGEAIVLVEYGSGSSTKTKLLLEHIPAIKAYIPIDISREHLLLASDTLSKLYPRIDVLPVCADYSQAIPLDVSDAYNARTCVFFPGSTLGNFDREHAIDFLKRMHDMVGPGGGLLIGLDLVKDSNVLHAAYNDEEGVTAEFNLNILQHLNDRLGSDFDLPAFEHHAHFDPEEERIEMNLVSRKKQTVKLNGSLIEFLPGETIRTEYSHKYRMDSFRKMAERAGFQIDSVWTDSANYFSVQYLLAK